MLYAVVWLVDLWPFICIFTIMTSRSLTSFNHNRAIERTLIAAFLLLFSTSYISSADVDEISPNVDSQSDIRANNNETSAKTNAASNETVPRHCVFVPQSEPKNANFVLIYILICIYSFLAVTVTCHNYFVTSLSRICDHFKLSEDIVGATFMAAGSSAPELATVIIAVFSTKDDIGISDVIGSAVFNMLFVIALCGLFGNTSLQVSWWPLLRNCFFYTVSIMIMLLAIANEQVSWLESVLLIATYVLYCVALYYNELLEAWAHTLPLPFNSSHENIVEESDANYIPLKDRKSSIHVSPNERTSIQSNGKIIISNSDLQPTYHTDTGSLSQADQLALPPDSGVLQQLKFYFLNPVYFVCTMTIPDWQGERFHDLYLLTFLVSFVWISVYSYIMIWMITLIGAILRIPNTVMGLTLVAAGVSVPDAVTSLKVAKQGFADMAISNAIGSNIFDILVCLGVPWFLQTAVVLSGSYVKVYSKGMIYSTVLLFSTVILLITAIHHNGWRLDRKLGTKLMIGYVIFIVIAVFYELFGNVLNRGCAYY